MSIRKRKNTRVKTGYVFEVYFTYKDFNGVTQRFSKSGFTTKKSAKDYEIEMKNKVIQQGDLQMNKTITFNECFHEYMSVEGDKYAPSTLAYYNYTFKNYIEPSIGNREIYTLRYRDIQRYFNDMSRLGFGTVKNIKKVFNVTFKYSLRSGYIPSDPMNLIELKNNDKKEDKLMEINEDQFRKLCMKTIQCSNYSPDKEVNEWNGFNYFIALQIGWYLGLRISEALALKKEDFNFEQKTVQICRRVEYHHLRKRDIYLTDRLKTKGSKDVLPLADPLIQLLKLWFKENPYDLVVCDIDGRIIHPASISRKVSICAKELGFDFRYHMLRHSLASRLARNNISPNIAKELLRHSDITTTLGKYTHINDDDKREALHKIFD